MSSVKTIEAKAAFHLVGEEAEKIKSDEHESVDLTPGWSIRQGDVYIIALGVTPKKAKDFVGRQLAPGTTQGSRHVAEGDCELFVGDEAELTALLAKLVPETKGERQFFGPVIVAKGPVTITHPEHGDRTIPCGDTYLVTYQRAGVQQMRRVED